MLVNINLGQMLALTSLVQKKTFAWESKLAIATMSSVANISPVVGYSPSGDKFEFTFQGKVKLNGVYVDSIEVGVRLIPVIPTWYGEDMDDIWQDMPVHDGFDWESEDFRTTPMVSAVARIINGGW